jgi:hypothetical protein
VAKKWINIIARVAFYVSPYDLTPIVDPANLGEDNVWKRHINGRKPAIFKQKTLKHIIIGDINSHDLAIVVNIRGGGQSGTGDIK